MGCDGPVHSVEVVLDQTMDRLVRDDWATLAGAGLPSQGRHTGQENRPHITLALTQSITIDVEERLSAVESSLPLVVALGGLLLFGSRRLVLARLAVPSAALLEFQARVVASLELYDPHENFAPGHWTPHVTLARRLTAAQVGTALAVLNGSTHTSGAVVRVRTWDINAKRENWLGPH